MTDPPVQKDLFTRRYRKVPEIEPSELQLQISLVEWCRWKLRPNVLVWHTPNGEVRDKRTAAKLKAMGVLPGVADLVFMWGNIVVGPKLLFLELKAPGRSCKLSPEQQAFSVMVREMGATYRVTDNIDEAIRIIGELGLTK
jgi:hypothetical protein